MSELIPAGQAVDGWSWKFTGPVKRYTGGVKYFHGTPRVLRINYNFYRGELQVGADCLIIVHGDRVTPHQGKAAATLMASWLIGLARSVTDGTLPGENRVGYWLVEKGVLTQAAYDEMKDTCINQALYGSPTAPFDIDSALSGGPSDRIRHAGHHYRQEEWPEEK